MMFWPESGRYWTKHALSRANFYWGFLAIGMMAGVTWAGAQPFAVGMFAEPWDKVAHMVLFGSLAFVVGMAFCPDWKHGWRWALVVALLFAGFDEVRQIWLPGRVAAWGDFLADAVGAGLGIVAAECFNRARKWLTSQTI